MRIFNPNRHLQPGVAKRPEFRDSVQQNGDALQRDEGDQLHVRPLETRGRASPSAFRRCGPAQP